MRLLSSTDVWVEGNGIGDDELALVMTRTELGFLANSIQEALEFVEEWEFATRLGFLPDEARMLRDHIGSFLTHDRPDE
jgi:hypothetical protein